MKKSIILSAIIITAISAYAQTTLSPRFTDNWTAGIYGGTVTPMRGHAFWGSMRGQTGINIEKQVSPILGIGAEGLWSINTSGWNGRVHSATAFDDSYAGVYGSIDLFNLFDGYNCKKRPLTVRAVAGAGWIHTYQNGLGDFNDFGTKIGLDICFSLSDNVSIGIRPAIIYNMTAGASKQSAAAYNINKATLALQAGLAYHFGGVNFPCVKPFNQVEVNTLNGQINELRTALDARDAEIVKLRNNNKQLAGEAHAAKSRPMENIKEVDNRHNTVHYVFYEMGSSAICASQQPTIYLVAKYLKNNTNSTVSIRGYASPDGPLALNIRLAEDRAKAVKETLVNKYKIAPERITAKGDGIGDAFTERAWNRVSICTVQPAK